LSYTLTYFDFPGGRGEDCRLAFQLAGVDWEDDRVAPKTWSERKGSTPWGTLPVLSVDGTLIGQSNAILTYIGRTYGLHPSDAVEAARHEAVLLAVETFRAKMSPSLREKDAEAKKAMRTEAAATFIPEWGQWFEREIEGPFLSGDTLQVADLKLFVLVKWFKAGVLDHIPTDVFKDSPKLEAHHDAVRGHPTVAAWYA